MQIERRETSVDYIIKGLELKCSETTFLDDDIFVAQEKSFYMDCQSQFFLRYEQDKI